MIPKIIHYCWFGRNPLPKQYKDYIASWKKFCPDYEIIEWNEDNFDISINKYCREAYGAKKWAFVSDYARLKIIYDHGGIYLDTDVEILKDLTPLVSSGVGFIGFQNTYEANTGLGFAAPQNNSCVGKMLELYETRSFKLDDGSYDLTPCPVVNTVALKMCGLKIGKGHCNRLQKLEGIIVYPEEYFNPMNADTMKCTITGKTYTVHRYASSWNSEKQKRIRKLKKYIPGALLKLRTEHISRKDIERFEGKITR